MDSDGIRVEPVAGYAAIWMIWNAAPSDHDVVTACKQLTALLDEATERQSILVDLRANPNFPISATVHNVLGGPAQHRNLQRWFVIGGGRIAKVIGGVISRTTRRENILWFDTVEETLAALARLA